MKRTLLAGCILVSLIVLGCAQLVGASDASAGEASPPGVVLQFIGHDCFLLTTQTGARILMDPYGDDPGDHPGGTGLVPRDLVPDAITVSHDHYDHNNVGCAKGAPALRAAGTYHVDDVTVTGYAGCEGSPRGGCSTANVIFVFEVAGTKIVHLGDSGVVTDALTLAAISDADVVIVNIDDYVIPWSRIHTFMAEIRARTVIVAHYTGRAWALMAPSVVGAPAVVNYFRQLPDDIVRVVSAESSLGVLPGMPSQFLELTPATLIK